MKSIIVSLIGLLMMMGCNPQYATTSTTPPQKPIHIIEVDWSGNEVLFVKIGDDFKTSSTTLNKTFSLMNDKYRFINYSQLENQYGKIVGKFYIKGSEYLQIQMNDGRKIKFERKNWDIRENTLPNYLCLTEETDILRKLVGHTIWLNKTKDFSFTSFTTFFTFSNKPFNRFDEVEIIDILQYYNGGSDRPLWFEIKSKEDEVGYVRYNPINRKKMIDNYYYATNPLPKEWGEETIELVRSGKIRIGMIERQVRVSWGNPSDINTTITEYGKREQWVYKQPYKTSYVYIENGKVVSIQN